MIISPSYDVIRHCGRWAASFKVPYLTDKLKGDTSFGASLVAEVLDQQLLEHSAAAGRMPSKDAETLLEYQRSLE